MNYTQFSWENPFNRPVDFSKYAREVARDAGEEIAVLFDELEGE